MPSLRRCEILKLVADIHLEYRVSAFVYASRSRIAPQSGGKPLPRRSSATELSKGGDGDSDGEGETAVDDEALDETDDDFKEVLSLDDGEHKSVCDLAKGSLGLQVRGSDGLPSHCLRLCLLQLCVFSCVAVACG